MRYSRLFLVFVYFFKFCVHDFFIGLRLAGAVGGGRTRLWAWRGGCFFVHFFGQLVRGRHECLCGRLDGLGIGALQRLFDGCDGILTYGAMDAAKLLARK